MVVGGSGEPVPGIFIKLDPDLVFVGEGFSFFYRVGKFFCSGSEPDPFFLRSYPDTGFF